MLFFLLTRFGSSALIVEASRSNGVGTFILVLRYACTFLTFVTMVTGLDAFQAEQVMETLRQLAEDGHTVITSIHQPRGSIYAKFDDLVLLSEGSLVYAGPAGDDALSYFEKIG